MGILTPVMRVVSMLWMPLMELDITIMYYVKGFLKGAKAICKRVHFIARCGQMKERRILKIIATQGSVLCYLKDQTQPSTGQQQSSRTKATRAHQRKVTRKKKQDETINTARNQRQSRKDLVQNRIDL